MRSILSGIVAALIALPASSPASAGKIRHVVVIAMENTDARQIYGRPSRAPYINGELMPKHARATRFLDKLDISVPSEPHYVLMEAATNQFDDRNFDDDDDPSAVNSTASTDHLANRLDAAGKTWRTYQEDMNARTGACPVTSHFPYVAKHNPYVFFRDVAGSPPNPNEPRCVAHTRPYSTFARDLARGDMAHYTFITPNICNDMHGDPKCPAVDRIKAGDAWLKRELPQLIGWANRNAGVIFLVWDEGVGTDVIPFFAIGPGVVPGRASATLYDHRSLVRSVGEIFDLTPLPKIGAAANFADLFRPGEYP